MKARFFDCRHDSGRRVAAPAKRFRVVRQVKISLALALLAACAALADGRQVVAAPIVVDAGDTLVVAPGRELLFTGYTGIEVRPGGHLRAVGDKARPIVFTSVNDTAGAGAPFDWNGIEVKGTAEFAYCLITNATSGITADDAQSVALTECTFGGNGQWHLSLAGEIQTVPEMQPYSYAYSAASRTAASTPEADKTAARIPAPGEIAVSPESSSPSAPEAIPASSAEKPKKDSRRVVLAWSLGGAGAAAAIGGTVSLISANQTAKKYDGYVPGTSDYDAATPQERQKQFDKFKKDVRLYEGIGWSLIGIAAADLLYLTIFF